MDEKSGAHSVPIITGPNESSEMRHWPTDIAGEMRLMVGSSEFSIDDAIQMHLVDCDQCRNATTHGRPVPPGRKSGHCNQYWELQLARAKYEGIVNNIGHVTEYGDEAPVIGHLEP